MGSKRQKKIKPSQALATDSAGAKPVHQFNFPVGLSFQYFVAGDTHCLSNCNQDEVRRVMDCLRRLTTLSWQQVLNTGGKDPAKKTGLHYCGYADGALRGVTRPAGLSADIKIVGVRASDVFRIFGAYHKHVFYILWFNRDHSIVPV